MGCQHVFHCKDASQETHCHAGDLATVFMLEDRVSARTNAGGDSNEFDPASAPDSGAIATALVGNVSVSNWAGNATIENGMRALRVCKVAVCSSDFLFGISRHISCLWHIKTC